jgi:hypothetical protein
MIISRRDRMSRDDATRFRTASPDAAGLSRRPRERELRERLAYSAGWKYGATSSWSNRELFRAPI